MTQERQSFVPECFSKIPRILPLQEIQTPRESYVHAFESAWEKLEKLFSSDLEERVATDVGFANLDRRTQNITYTEYEPRSLIRFLQMFSDDESLQKQCELTPQEIQALEIYILRDDMVYQIRELMGNRPDFLVTLEKLDEPSK